MPQLPLQLSLQLPPQLPPQSSDPDRTSSSEFWVPSREAGSRMLVWGIAGLLRESQSEERELGDFWRQGCRLVVG